ncbi:hypothetical protein HIV01_007775 [Lysobacter arenosi]|uniref:Uncharacterized protein n=1 Tax=Lysobacter arenosi TaxID=2795387 RepID=A0ABX7RFV7_9GAMM|nr:ESPR-type extended signal peptide-containing protein [Lysobacter arenosi]QSX76363.1 hypothetical protein HIV01_007775 [Lysobacter arenosi]
MNKIFRIVFNTTTGQWVVASEMAKGRKKASSSGKVGAAVAATLVAALAASGASAGALDGGTAIGLNSVSVGPGSQANGDDSTAVGSNAVSAINGTAIGMNSTAGANAVSLGKGSFSGSGATAIGENSYALEAGDIAIGLGAKATNVNNNPANGAVAIGYLAVADSSGVAIGTGANAGVTDTVVGRLATATGNYSSAFGSRSTAQGDRNVALGSYSVADRDLTVSVGTSTMTRQIVNVGAGVQPTDAVNVSQLTPVVTALGGGAAMDGTTGAVTGPSYALTNANAINGTTGAATNVGTGFSKVDDALGVINTTASKGFNVSADAGATSQNIAPGGTVNYAAGSNATVTRSGSTITYGVVDNPTFSGMVTANGGLTVGTGKTVDMGGNKITNVAVGTNPTDAVNVSQLSALSGTAMTFTGNDATAGVVNRTLGQTLAIKGAASTAGTYSGNNVKTVTDPVTGAINVQIADAPKFGNVIVNDSGSGKITGMTDGTVASGSKDAVNGGQLYGLASSTATALGGSSSVNAAGAITAPTYTLAKANAMTGQTGSLTDVGSALNRIDQALGNVGFNITADNGATLQNISPSSTVGFVAGANTTVTRSGRNITYGVVANPTFSGMVTANGGLTVGTGQTVDMGGNKITNVAVGTAATDAVNVSQLSALSGTAMTFTGNDATAGVVSRTLGQTLTIKGAASTAGNYSGNNVKTVTDPATGAINVQIADAPKFGNVIVNDSGLGKITGMTDGTVASGSKDAVNGGQLYTTNQQVAQQGATTAAALGGTASYDTTTGAVSAPSYALTNANAINGTTGAATNVGTGFSKVDDALGVINTTANKGFNVSADAGATSQNIAPGGTVNYAAGTNATVTRSGSTITYGVVANPTFAGMVTANGGLTVGAGQTVDMGGNKVTNVAVGTAATDAVNVSQLSALSGTAMTFTGNDATAGVVNRTLGQTLAIKGAASTAGTYSGNNVKTVTDPATGAINVQIADAPKFGNVIVNDAGSGKITGMTDGTVASGSKDAVNGGQLYTTNQQVAQQGTTTAAALGGSASYNTTTGAISAPSYTLTKANTITGQTGSLGDVGSALGRIDQALGNLTTSGGLGFNISADAGATSQNIAPGGTVTYAAGTNATVARSGSTITYGVVDNPSFAGMVTANGGLTVGAGQTVSMGGNKVTNVAAGTVDTTSTDAVNGSQLSALASTTAVALGGSSTVNPDGSITAPSYTVTNIDGSTTTVHNVGDAITNIDGRTTQNTTAINNINTSITGLSKDALLWDSAAGAFSAAHGGVATNKVTNVAAGDLTSTSTDAVNGSQLYATNQQVAGNTTAINNINTSITGLTKDALLWDSAAGAFSASHGGVATNKITNVAAGTVDTASTDAVNGSQLSGLASTTAVALGGSSTVNPDGSITAPNYTVTNIDGSTTTVHNVGDAITNIDGRTTQNTTTINSIVNGGGIKYFHTNSTLADSQALGTDSVAIGGNAVANNQNDVALGSNSVTDVAVGTSSATIGGTNYSFAGTAPAGTVSVGSAGSERTVTNVAAGRLSGTSTDAVNGSQLYATNQQVTANTTAIDGINSSITGLSKDALLWDSAAGAFSASHGGVATNKITNVAAGTVNATSTDAVNGSQLYGLASTTAGALGGGSTVNPDGTITQPNYTVTNIDGSTTTVHNVGDAITNIDGRTTQNTTAISNISTSINNGTIGLVQQAGAGQKLTVGKDTDGSEVSFTNSAGEARKLSGVAAGSVSATSTDAVNGSQLHGLGQSVSTALGGGSVVNTDGTISAPVYTVTNPNGSTSQVTGVEAAIGNIDGRVYDNSVRIGNVESNVTNLTSQINTGAVGLVQQAAPGEQLTVGKATDGTSVNFTGTAGDRVLTGVAAGKADTDAVNVRRSRWHCTTSLTVHPTTMPSTSPSSMIASPAPTPM